MELVLVQHALQLIARLADTFPAHPHSKKAAQQLTYQRHKTSSSTPDNGNQIRTQTQTTAAAQPQHALALRKKAPVVAVHNKDKALGVLIVVAPEGADLVLATHIPNSEADVLVPDRPRVTNSHAPQQPHSLPARANSLNGLNVANGGNSGDLAHKSAAAAEASRISGEATYDFTELQIVQDGGLAGSVEPNHQNTHFLFSKKSLEQQTI